MASSVKIPIGIDGAKQFNSDMQQMAAVAKQLDAEMKALKSGFTDATSASEKNQAMLTKLTQQYENAKSQVQRYSEQIEALEEAMRAAGGGTDQQVAALTKLKTGLANAQTEMNNASRAIDELGEEEEDTTEKTFSLGDALKANLASAAITAGVQAIASAVKAVGEKLLELGKQSIQAYADYEQLVGGIETLFGANGQSLEEYAEATGRTVDAARADYDKLIEAQNAVVDNSISAASRLQMSQNEYMDLATSFSASMIQSLNGDTKAAADMTDLAITDIMDNVNKMGTDIESVQNAYKGFSKGTYTMLDNLKLGYSGTKEEMQRLLDDAEKLSGIHYNIENFSDIVSAIHVIQDNMGIAGTSAKEALTTITGSINATKAAWTNLLTHMGDSNADIKKYVDELVNNVLAVVKNVSPIIEQIAQNIPVIIEALSPAIEENLPMLLEIATEIITALGKGLIDALPLLAKCAVKIITELAKYLLEHLPEIIQAGIELIMALIDGMMEMLGPLLEAAINLIGPFIETIGKTVSTLYKKMMSWIKENIVQPVKDKINDMREAGRELIDNFIKKVGDTFATIASKIKQWVQDHIVQPIKDKVQAVKDIGRNLVEGLWSGITDKISWLYNKVSGWVSDTLGYIKRLFGISSPSKVTRRYGEYLGEGLAEGIIDSQNLITKAWDKTTSGIVVDANSSLVTATRESGLSRSVTATLDGNQLANVLSNTAMKTEVDVNFIGSLAMLASVLQPVISYENNRVGPSLVNG